MERAVTFGPRGELVGILSVPDAGPTADHRPAVLMWNVGVNHRVGPFRVHVDLARRLAELGFASLRFDASGRGDSEARREALQDREREVLDVRDAMEFMAKRAGVQTFVLLGFCSSVDAAHRTAVADPRVVGAIHLEGYAYRTRGFRRRLPLRLLSARRWERYFKHKRDSLLARVSGRDAGAPAAAEAVYQREYPDWRAFTRELEQLVARKVRMLFVYVGGDTDYNYPLQFLEMFDSPHITPSTVEIDYYPNADHTFFGVDARRAVIERVSRFMLQRFGSASVWPSQSTQLTRDRHASNAG